MEKNTAFWYEKITRYDGSIRGFDVSPDETKIVFVGTERKAKDKAKPIEIDRYQFKQDRQGFLEDTTNHLYIADLVNREISPFANDNRNYQSPSWSPNGKLVAYVTKKEDSDRHNNSDLFYRQLNDPTKEIQLTFDLGSDSAGWSAGGLQWSNDSEKICLHCWR